MFSKVKKKLIFALLTVVAAILAIAAAFMLAPETKSARAAGAATPPTLYWGIDNGDLVIAASDSEVMMCSKQGSFTQFSSTVAPWSEYRQDIRTVKINNCVRPLSTAYWFYGLSTLTTVDLSGLDASAVTDMSNMFMLCESLTSIELSIDTSQVTVMYQMFYGCSRLTDITFTNTFNTSQVEDMHGMFYGCRALTSLDLSGWDTSKVKNMNSLFEGCSMLTSITFPRTLNTSSLTSMTYMFFGCSALISLDMSGFNISNVTEIDRQFSGCSALNTITVSESLAQKLQSDTADKTKLYNLHTTWYNTSDGKAYTSTDRFGKAGTYTSCAPYFKVEAGEKGTYYIISPAHGRLRNFMALRR